MSANPTVSVIIAAYNAENFIKRAISSALEQTYAPLEIIVIDDCSSDGTKALLEAEAASNPTIKIVALPRNGGPSAARNAGITAATGDWLAILDADDAFLPNRLACLLPFAVETEADFVADDLAYYDAAAGCVTGSGMGHDIKLPDGPIGLRDFIAHNLADGRGLDWGLLKPIFRRRVLLERNIQYDTNLTHGEDFQLVVDLLLSGAKFWISPQPLYLYTQRMGGVSKRASGQTRTAIAYGKLKQAAEALSRDPRIAGDPDLVVLLRRRAQGLGRLDDAHYISGALRSGAFFGIVKRAWNDANFLPHMLAQIGRAIRRRLQATQ